MPVTASNMNPCDTGELICLTQSTFFNVEVFLVIAIIVAFILAMMLMSDAD